MEESKKRSYIILWIALALAVICRVNMLAHQFTFSIRDDESVIWFISYFWPILVRDLFFIVNNVLLVKVFSSVRKEETDKKTGSLWLLLIVNIIWLVCECYFHGTFWAFVGKLSWEEWHWEGTLPSYFILISAVNTFICIRKKHLRKRGFGISIGILVIYTISLSIPENINYEFSNFISGRETWIVPSVYIAPFILMLSYSIGMGLSIPRTKKIASNVKTQPQEGEVVMGNKSKVIAGLLAFFLGGTGAHRYYLGYKKQGIIQTCGLVSLIIGYSIYLPAMLGDGAGLLLLAALFLLYGVAIGIWAFVDFIRILTGGLMPADGSAYTESRPAQVQVVQSAPSASDNADALEKLAKLHEQGILTDEEFQQKKADILAKM